MTTITNGAKIFAKFSSVKKRYSSEFPTELFGKLPGITAPHESTVERPMSIRVALVAIVSVRVTATTSNSTPSIKQTSPIINNMYGICISITVHRARFASPFYCSLRSSSHHGYSHQSLHQCVRTTITGYEQRISRYLSRPIFCRARAAHKSKVRMSCFNICC
jgi:hypothetical protein